VKGPNLVESTHQLVAVSKHFWEIVVPQKWGGIDDLIQQ